MSNRNDLQSLFTTLLEVLFRRLQANPSDSLKARFVRFYHLVSAKGKESGLGADFFINQAEALQQGVFTPVYLNIIIKTTKQFARPIDRKIGVISYAKTLYESDKFAHTYLKGWGITCENLLGLLQNPPEVTGGFGDEIITEADVDDIGFGVGFTPLNTCKRGPRDDFPEIRNVQHWVRDALTAANRGGEIKHRVQDVNRFPDDKTSEPQVTGEQRRDAAAQALSVYLQ